MTVTMLKIVEYNWRNSNYVM